MGDGSLSASPRATFVGRFALKEVFISREDASVTGQLDKAVDVCDLTQRMEKYLGDDLVMLTYIVRPLATERRETRRAC